MYSSKWILFLIGSLIYFSGNTQTIGEWYDAAQSRIDTLRKGSFGISIYDSNGQPYEGPVKVKMAKHEFPFGIAFDFYEGEIQTDVPTETQWMKAAMYKYFNYGVSGNSFKWSGIDPNGNGPNYTNFENALNWTQKVGWDLRAHTLLWGGAEGDNHAMPQWVTRLGTADAVYAACEERIRREVSRYKGLVKEYDVINEPLHATYTQDLYGDSLNWKSFQWARDEDPSAELFVNEYNVEYGWGDADEYKVLIEEMLAQGAPVTGIGIQAHFWDCCRPNVTEFVTQLNKLAELGLPIKLTEFDYGGNLSEAEQAADFIKVVTIAFSHPSINGMISWALSDLSAWRENTGYFHADHRPKLAADTLLYLTKNRWATNLEEELAGGAPLIFDAYYGDYLVEVQFGDSIKEFNIPCLKANEDTVFQLYQEEGPLKPVDLIEANVIGLNLIKATFDQSINPETINKYDFRVFASNDVAISNIDPDPEDDHTLMVYLDKGISITDYVTISYFPGSLLAANGAQTRAFGTEKVGVDESLNQAPVVEEQSFEVSEHTQGGALIGTLVSSDPEGGDLIYKIISGNHLGIFGIDTHTGAITLLNPFYLDHEQTPFYELVVEVSDGFHVVTTTVTIHVIVVLGADPLPESFTLYPNPSREHVHFDSQHPVMEIQLYNVSGKQIYSKRFDQPVFNGTIIPDVPPGLYILKMIDPDFVETSGKLIRNP